MQRASKLFNDAQRKQIDEAVAQAESGTSAEIVPVVASASGRYDRPEDIAGLWVGVIAMIFAYIFLPRPSGLVGHWDDPLPWLHLLYLILVLLAGLRIQRSFIRRQAATQTKVPPSTNETTKGTPHCNSTSIT